MPSLSEPKQRRHHLGSSRSIRNLLERRWLVVVLALALTGLGAAITGLLFKSGMNLLRDWRLDLLKDLPAWVVLPALGAFGGLVSGWLVTNLAPAAGGAGITHIMGFLRHRSVPMGLRVGLVKLVAGIIAIGCGFPLGPEDLQSKWGVRGLEDVPLVAGTCGLPPCNRCRGRRRRYRCGVQRTDRRFYLRD